MLVYTHVSRQATGKVVNGKKEMKTVLTDGVQIPTTLDDVRTMIDDSVYQARVKVVLNEQGGASLKQELEVPFLCKLLIDSIKLLTNAKAKLGGGVNALKIVSGVLADASSSPEDKAGAVAAMATGDQKVLKAWAEAYLDRKNGSEPSPDADEDDVEGDQE